jgi:hypothetical protein
MVVVGLSHLISMTLYIMKSDSIINYFTAMGAPPTPKVWSEQEVTTVFTVGGKLSQKLFQNSSKSAQNGKQKFK